MYLLSQWIANRQVTGQERRRGTLYLKRDPDGVLQVVPPKVAPAAISPSSTSENAQSHWRQRLESSTVMYSLVFGGALIFVSPFGMPPVVRLILVTMVFGLPVVLVARYFLRRWIARQLNIQFLQSCTDILMTTTEIGWDPSIAFHYLDRSQATKPPFFGTFSFEESLARSSLLNALYDIAIGESANRGRDDPVRKRLLEVWQRINVLDELIQGSMRKSIVD